MRGVFDSIVESSGASRIVLLQRNREMSYQDWVSMSGKTSGGLVVTLRPLHIDDVDAIGRWRNLEEMRQLLNVDYPVTFENVRDWVQNAIANKDANPADIPLAICVDGKFVGCCGLHGISLRHRHATLGIYIGDQERRGGGVGSAVYELLLKYAFRELDLRLVCAYVYGNNGPSKALHLKVGFAQVGCIPVWQFRDATYQDFLTYCISKEQWLALQK